jgi:hypothetical protein
MKWSWFLFSAFFYPFLPQTEDERKRKYIHTEYPTLKRGTGVGIHIATISFNSCVSMFHKFILLPITSISNFDNNKRISHVIKMQILIIISDWTANESILQLNHTILTFHHPQGFNNTPPELHCKH